MDSPTLSPTPTPAYELAPIISPGTSPHNSPPTLFWSDDSDDTAHNECYTFSDSDDDDDSIQVVKVAPSPKVEIVVCGLTKIRNDVPVNCASYDSLVDRDGLGFRHSPARKLPRTKQIILEHGLPLGAVLSNVYLDKGCKFIAVPGPKGYFNFAILDPRDLRHFELTTDEYETQAQMKYEDLLQRTCIGRHIT